MSTVVQREAANARNAALREAADAVVDLPCRHAADFGAGPYVDPGPCLVDSEQVLSALDALSGVTVMTTLRDKQVDNFVDWLFRHGGLELPRREYDQVRQRVALFALAAQPVALDVKRLAEAILVAAKEEDRRPTSDGFEWYGSADEMAEDILAALRESDR